MEMLFGMLGAILCIGIFILGFCLGWKLYKPKAVDISQPTDEELIQIQEERQRLIEDQKAFRELMSYNADMAYRKEPTGE